MRLRCKQRNPEHKQALTGQANRTSGIRGAEAPARATQESPFSRKQRQEPENARPQLYICWTRIHNNGSLIA